MLASDKQALRALLLTLCNRSNPRASSDLDAQGVLDDVLSEAQAALADIGYSWNLERTCCRLPVEVIAVCLSYLPIPSRVCTSRVSRAWRVAALTSPSFWADISEGRSRLQLTVSMLQTALSRSGTVPLLLEFGHELKGEMLQLVYASMHRVAYLQLYLNADRALLEQPAPLLRTLHVAGTARLTKNFLSGYPGRLANLHTDRLHFDNSYLGLSNLTTLISNRCTGATLAAIFAMCPRIRKLNVRFISGHSVQSHGQPPQSLTDLTLGTEENDAPLLSVFAAYRPSFNLKRVELHYDCDERGWGQCETAGCNTNDLGLALHGVVGLSISVAFPELYIGASYAGEQHLLLFLQHMFPRDWLSGFAPIFKQPVERFEKLRALKMSVFALEAFSSYAPPMPALLELTLDISTEVTLEAGIALQAEECAYPWHLLRFLAAVSQRRIVLNVQRHLTGHGPPIWPTADDARALVEELANVAGLFEVRVAGFTPDTVPRDHRLKAGIDLVFVS